MQGIFTALITPFAKSGKIDYQSLTKLMNEQANSQITGIVLFGSTAEEKLLTKSEKQNILQMALKILAQKQIYIGINQISSKAAQKEIKQYNQFAISGFLISPPPYLKLNSTEVVNFFTQVAKSTQKNICIYNVPTRTGTNITISALERLSKIPNITSIKDATGNISFAKQVKTKISNINLLCGNDNLYFKMKKLGASGAVCVIGNLFPNLFSNIDSKNGKNIWREHSELIKFVSQNQNPSAIKAIMSLCKNITYKLRDPLSANQQLSSKAIHILSNLQKFS